MTEPTLKYRVALSFAGEDRAFAQALADALHTRGMGTVHHEYEQHILREKSYHPPLQDICQLQIHCSVMLISEHYLRKCWTSFPLPGHWKPYQYQDYTYGKYSECLIPIKLGNIVLPGWGGTANCLDAGLGTERIADILIERLRHGSSAQTFTQEKNITHIEYAENRPQTQPIPVHNEAKVQADDEDEEMEISNEILEIFVESASEAVEVISQRFPRWTRHFEDSKSLAELRRAFHSLKGDGRMVGARDISELAWSIENMLNAVIERYILPNRYVVGLVERVHLLLPILIEAFGHKQPNPHPHLTEIYTTWGNALSNGVTPNDLKVQIDTRTVAWVCDAVKPATDE